MKPRLSRRRPPGRSLRLRRYREVGRSKKGWGKKRFSDQTEMMKSLNECYEYKYVYFRQHMTPAMATVPNQLKSPTRHCQESCRYDDAEVWTVRPVCFTRSFFYHVFFFLLLMSHLPSQWQNNLQRTITTPGVEKRRWSCSPKVRGHSVQKTKRILPTELPVTFFLKKSKWELCVCFDCV